MLSISRWYRKGFFFGTGDQTRESLLSLLPEGLFWSEQKSCSLCCNKSPESSPQGLADTIRCSASGHEMNKVTCSPYHPTCHVLSGSVVSRQPRPSNVSILSLEGKGTSHPRTSLQGCLPAYNAFEATTTHLSSLFMTLTFPFPLMSSWLGCNFPSKLFQDLLHFFYHLPRYLQRTILKPEENPVALTGTWKTLPRCFIPNQGLPYRSQAHRLPSSPKPTRNRILIPMGISESDVWALVECHRPFLKYSYLAMLLVFSSVKTYLKL